MLAVSRLTDSVETIMQTNLAEARATDSLRAAATTMAEDGLGALLVRRGTHVIGIISERDIVLAVGDGSDVDETRVLDVMTENLAGVSIHSTVGTALERMAAHGVRHLVIRDEAAIKGVVSVRDVMRALHAEAESEVDG